MGNKEGKPTLEAHPVGPVLFERRNGASKAGQRLDRQATSESIVDREKMARKYSPLVYRLCRRFNGYGEPLDDLAQVGTIGLLKAIGKYDSARGVSFITYAVPVIVGEIKNYLRDHRWAVKVPRKLQRHKLAVHRAVDSIGQILGRAPTIPEIVEATGLTQEQVMDTFEIPNYSRPLSLDAEYASNGEASCLLDYVGHEDPEFDRSSDKIDLSKTFGCLGNREKAIIYLKFYGGQTQAEIAKRLGISQTHVSRLQRKALGKLKQSITE